MPVIHSHSESEFKTLSFILSTTHHGGQALNTEHQPQEKYRVNL